MRLKFNLRDLFAQGLKINIDSLFAIIPFASDEDLRQLIINLFDIILVQNNVINIGGVLVPLIQGFKHVIS